jgi:hypothetical protein
LNFSLSTFYLATKSLLPGWQGRPLRNAPVEHFREEPERGMAYSAIPG